MLSLSRGTESLAPPNLQEDPRKLLLPKLRDDLVLLEDDPDETGQLRWKILDTASNRFFSIGYAAFHMFRLWSRCKNLGQLVELVNQETSMDLDIEQGNKFLTFLCFSNLIVGTSQSFIKQYLQTLKRVKIHWFKRLIHNYLFFRIPLIFPDGFLTRTYPYVRFFFKSKIYVLFAIIGVIGLFVATRQWEVYVSTFLDFVSLKGIGFYLGSIVFAKILHEFGHAYCAKHFGCNVPSMGIAFLVMWPILYTDATTAWKLRKKKQRLLIDSAGVIVEICLAATATFLWAFLPDGPLRSTCFAMATITLVSTLAVNLNFLMRFDGYYILGDLLGIDNLQTRGFLMGKWRLREALFRLNEPPPERVTPRVYRIFLFYSYLVWVYRFFLFLGIALLVYNLFFKALGIILFVVEILYFIILPIYREVKVWIKKREQVRWNHASKRTLLITGVIVILLCWPWKQELFLPAILESDDLTAINTRVVGRVKEVYVKNYDTVSKHDILIEMESPELEANYQSVLANLNFAERAERMTALSSEHLRENNLAIEQSKRFREELRAIKDEIASLTIRTPIDGQVFDFHDRIKPGLWLAKDEAVMYIGNTTNPVVYAYLEEKDFNRTQQQSRPRATFIPNDYGWDRLPLNVQHIGTSNVQSLDEPALASTFGGPINTIQMEGNVLAPVSTLYRIRLLPTNDTPYDFSSSIVGVVRISVASEIPIQAIFRIVVGTILREANL